MPNWQLLAQRPELAVRIREQGLQLLLVLELSAAKGKIAAACMTPNSISRLFLYAVPFANMRKTAVSKEDAAVTKLIQQGAMRTQRSFALAVNAHVRSDLHTFRHPGSAGEAGGGGRGAASVRVQEAVQGKRTISPHSPQATLRCQPFFDRRG
jgi:hypothetical protein